MQRSVQYVMAVALSVLVFITNAPDIGIQPDVLSNVEAVVARVG